MKMTVILAALLIWQANILVDATNEISCKPTPGSQLSSLLDGSENSLICTANDNAITQEQYAALNQRVSALERTASPEYLQRLVMTKIYEADGWVKSGNFVFKHFTDVKNYANAKSRCKELGGRLASGVLRNSDAVRYIIDNNFIAGYNGGKRPWVGFEDIENEGDWVWSDMGTTNAATTAWKPNEPNSSGGQEDCGNLFSTSGNMVLLNDEKCHRELNYICEIEIV